MGTYGVCGFISYPGYVVYISMYVHTRPFYRRHLSSLIDKALHVNWVRLVRLGRTHLNVCVTTMFPLATLRETLLSHAKLFACSNLNT